MFARFAGWSLPAAILLVLTCPTPSRAQLAQFETPDIRIVYVPGTESFLVPHAARTFLNSLTFQKTLFKFTPYEKPTVLLVDFSDFGQGAAGSVPRNNVRVQIAPMSYVFETLPANERLTMLANHELVHVATMDQATGRDLTFRKLFAGKVYPIPEQPESIGYFYLTSPRVATPRWYVEGIAVFIETWMGAGLGRAQGGYDEMVFRAMVKDGSHFYDPLGLVSEGTKIDFQVEANSYLYGGRFMTWVAYEYGPDKLIEWVARRPGSQPYFASQFRHVFGRSLESAWADWIAFEKTFQTQNLEAIRKYPVTETRDLSARALGSISKPQYDAANNRIYAALNYPGRVAHLGAISTTTGAVDHLVDIKGPRIYQVASLEWDPDANALYYTNDNDAYRDLMRLDLATGKTQVLQKDLRVGDLAMSRADRTLWGVRHLNGLASIVSMTAPYRDWKRVVTLPYGTGAYDLDISPDGTMLVAVFGEVSGRQKVKVLPIAGVLKGDLTPLAEFDFGIAIPNGFVFSPDGRYLYGSSYLTGVSNIFRYEVATKQLEAVTNAETGFFNPIPLGNDELIVFRYTGEGFVPARIAAAKPLSDLGSITFLGERTITKHDALKQWEVTSASAIDLDRMPQTTKPYHLSGGLKIESLYPIFQGYKDTGAIGVRLDLSDQLRLNNADISVSVSPDSDLPARERTHIAAKYERYDWHAHVAWNYADFYDLFGPTKRSRKGYSFGGGRDFTLIYDEPKRLDLQVNGRFAGGLDQLPQYQNITVRVDSLFSLAADLNYTFTRASLGAVDAEKGQKASLSFRGDYVNNDAFTRIYGTYDVGFHLPGVHSSVWIRNAAGFSPQDRREPFANFYFGGFGNNYVDRQHEKQYRNYYSFPGAELNSIGGRNFVRTMFEWNLPPVRFSRIGTQSAYLSWIRPAVFVSGLMTNLDSDPFERQAGTVGGQIDLRFTVLSLIDLTLSAGAGTTFEADRKPEHEGMISLRIMR